MQPFLKTIKMSLFEYEEVPLDDENFVLRPLNVKDYHKSIQIVV
jgi:hypothetical protein